MTEEFYHIVQVHPVELGKPNLHKVLMEREFVEYAKAKEFIKTYNKLGEPGTKAVYLGCVNDETGELV
jgi:hypothetical protein